jgi:hypothetical protein
MKTYAPKIGYKRIKPLMNIAVFIIIMLPGILFSQQYRTIEAYMNDFDRNETFLKKSLNDYSATLVYNNLESRSGSTSTRIIAKLKSINAILKRTDKGFEGNTLLRDSFIRMNEKTIECLTNGSLILNDYEKQSPLTIEEIRKNIRKKESDIEIYFDEIKEYEKTKSDFAATYKLPKKSVSEKNIFEYNAYQNILFYKINVMDQKLITLINARDKEGYNQCIDNLIEIHQEVIQKSAILKVAYKDASLNNANIDYADLILKQYSQITPLFNSYIDGANLIQKIKDASGLATQEAVDDYNTAVKLYNVKKNNFFDIMEKVQSVKKAKNDNWYIVNSTFLKNNIEFGDIYQRYTDND